MELWIGKEFMLSFFSVSLICFYFYILKMGDINSLYFNGSGLWWNGRYRSIVESLLNLFGNFILVIFWGVDGIILASIISVSMGHIWGGQFVFRLYYREIKFRQYFLMELSIFAVNAVLCSVFSFAAHFIKMENASFNFAAVLLFAAVIVTPVYVFVYLFLANRLKMKFDFKKMLKKGR
jgi:O-antigen/teichoic acid export membrane protein